MRALPGSVLGCRFFPFITLNFLCHSLLACKVSAEGTAESFMGIPLYVTCCFFLAAFNVLCLSLIFFILVTICLGVFLFGFSLGLSVIHGLGCLFPFPD